MWAKALLIVCLGIPLVFAEVSPNAEETLKKLYNAKGARYSNNITEDASLDVPELVRKYGYPLEVHQVTTEDGYILTMHRIPHGRDANNAPRARPVVLLMHGLLSSSADYIVMGPGSGFGYILAEEGYDVWMGNARGNYYSRQHVSLNPARTPFWKFSWDEIGNIDLPTMIDYVLAHTGQSRLHYIGHSQGTTAFFVMGSMKPAYNEKITSMHALAPVAYMANNRNPLFWYLAPYANDIEKYGALLGIGEFLPNNAIMTWAGQAMCRDEVVFQPLCSNILFLIGGWNEQQHNATMMPVIFGHSPAGASVRQIVHYGQGIEGKDFRRYDRGSTIANMLAYGKIRPPRYNLSKVTAPVFLHYSDNDPLAHVRDVDRLWSELGNPIGKFRIQLSKFSHLDFLWGIDAKELLYNRVINHMNAMEINGFIDNV